MENYPAQPEGAAQSAKPERVEQPDTGENAHGGAFTADAERRIASIEEQALEDRAEAYSRLHDDLVRELESADQPADD